MLDFPATNPGEILIWDGGSPSHSLCQLSLKGTPAGGCVARATPSDRPTQTAHRRAGVAMCPIGQPRPPLQPLLTGRTSVTMGGLSKVLKVCPFILDPIIFVFFVFVAIWIQFFLACRFYLVLRCSIYGQGFLSQRERNRILIETLLSSMNRQECGANICSKIQGQ